MDESFMDFEDSSVYFNHFIQASCEEDGLGMLQWWN
jgi:hypothetical protein